MLSSEVDVGNRHGPTLADVALEAGVSMGLASLALRGLHGPSEASRRLVLEAASRIGYRVNVAASLLARSETRTIGIVYDVYEQFEAELIEMMYNCADEEQYTVFLGVTTQNRNLSAALTPLVSGICEGLILIGIGEISADIEAQIRDIPTVVIGHPEGSDSFDVVKSADTTGVKEAVDHLVSLGHTRISHIDGADSSGSAGRRRAYRRAMSQHGLATYCQVQTGGPTVQDGCRAAERLLTSSPDTTAIIAYDDTCAWGVLHAVRKCGREVPGDLSVVGYGDDIISRDDFLNMTTVSQNSEKLCRTAFERLVQVIADPDVARTEYLIPPALVVRGSTAPPPSDV